MKLFKHLFLMYELHDLPPINCSLLLAQAHLTDIFPFRTILSSTESYDALEGRVNEIQALGEEYFNAFIFFAP